MIILRYIRYRRTHAVALELLCSYLPLFLVNSIYIIILLQPRTETRISSVKRTVLARALFLVRLRARGGDNVLVLVASYVAVQQEQSWCRAAS